MSSSSPNSKSFTTTLIQIFNQHYFKIVQEFLPQKELDTVTFTSRIKRFKKMQIYLRDHMNECIKYNRETNIYNIFDIFELKENEGINGKHGLIYMTKISVPIVIKVLAITSDNAEDIKLEVLINSIVSKKMNEKFSRHFVFTYKSVLCTNPSEHLPEYIKDKNYIICIQEEAHQSLYYLCTNILFIMHEGLMLNIIIQCLFAIIQFHSLGFYHQDLHAGNIFYILENNTYSYYKYKFDNKIFYLQNCGYTVALLDFGKADRHNGDISKLKNDLIDILYIFTKESGKGRSKKPILLKYYDHYATHYGIKRNELMRLLNNIPLENISNIVNEMINNINILNNIDEIIPLVSNFIKSYKLIASNQLHIINVIVDKLPSGSTCINEQPFIIDYNYKSNTSQSRMLSPRATIKSSSRT